MFLINFKTYPESTGEKALTLLKTIVEIANQSKVKIVVCPAYLDISSSVKLAQGSKVEIWAQHMEPSAPGQTTGHLTPEALVQAGVKGVILNHSEHKIVLGLLNETSVRAKSLGLTTLIFADNLKEAEMSKKLNPDWVGYEPSELVGSTETSVSKAKPEIVGKVVAKMGNFPVLVGAGIKDVDDVATALKLGAKGIGVASSVILAENPKQVIESLLMGFENMPTAPDIETLPHQELKQNLPQALQSTQPQPQQVASQNIGLGIAPTIEPQSNAKPVYEQQNDQTGQTDVKSK